MKLVFLEINAKLGLNRLSIWKSDNDKIYSALRACKKQNSNILVLYLRKHEYRSLNIEKNNGKYFSVREKD